MVPVGSWSFFSEIPSTQVGDALAHRQEGFIHCVSSDRLVGLSCSSVAQTEHEEVGELGLLSLEITEGRQDIVSHAEVAPHGKDLVLGAQVLGGDGSGGCLERKAKVSLEAVSVGRCSSFQGFCCG